MNLLLKKNKPLFILFCFFCSLLFSSTQCAAVDAWDINLAQSRLSFIATQNGAPVAGEFKKFNGKIYFNENDLQASHVSITVDMNSLQTSYAELNATLISAEWFNLSVFPKATFTSKQFSKIANDHYTVSGMLTIRDKTLPATLDFQVQKNDGKHVLIKGSTLLKRTAFNVGEGEWASTDEIKDAVEVKFTVAATKK